jgi:FOG: WD40-like repeat
VADGAVYFGSGDGNLYALDAATGDLRWKFKTGDVVHASPAFVNGVVFVGSWDSYFTPLMRRPARRDGVSTAAKIRSSIIRSASNLRLQ